MPASVLSLVASADVPSPSRISPPASPVPLLRSPHPGHVITARCQQLPDALGQLCHRLLLTSDRLPLGSDEGFERGDALLLREDEADQVIPTAGMEIEHTTSIAAPPSPEQIRFQLPI